MAEKKSKIKNENFYVIHGWMLNNLHLKGVQLQVFAIIYGFTQDGENEFTGSLQYLCDFCGGVSKPTIIKALKELVDENLLIKKEEYINSVQFNRYKVNLQVVNIFNRGSKEILPEVVKNLDGGSKETLTNKENNINKSDNKKDNIRHKYGEYQNVLLSDEDMEKLKTEFPNDYNSRIDNLSMYIASSGKSYKNHLATIRNWARKEKPKQQRVNNNPTWTIKGITEL